MRILDIFFSLVLCLILAIPLLIIILLIGPSPIFKQERIGLNNSRFILLKIRTMELNTTHEGQVYLDNNSITKIGRILRRFKIDELPQLYNILRGDMSIVGPRPLMDLQGIDEDLRMKRNSVRPGLTGLAQISGNIHLSLEQKILLDLKMIESLNLRSYCFYILRTFSVVILGEKLKK